MADPDDPAFGTQRWSLVGGATVDVLPSDLALIRSPAATTELTFGDQHLGLPAAAPACRAGSPGRPLYRGVPIDLYP